MAKGVDLAFGSVIANAHDDGVTKRLFDDSPEAHGHGNILGRGMVGSHTDDMICETIHPQPTLGESIQEGSALVDRCAKQCSDPSSNKRCARADDLYLTPLELISGKYCSISGWSQSPRINDTELDPRVN